MVHKTLAQWKQENPGVAETLVPYNLSSPSAEALPPEKYLYKTQWKYPENPNPTMLRKYFRYPSGFEVVFEYDVERKRYVRSEIIYPEVWFGYYYNRRFALLIAKEKYGIFCINTMNVLLISKQERLWRSILIFTPM